MLHLLSVQVTQDIYTVSIYSSVIQTLIVLLVTDILRYKPVVVIGALGFAIHKALLVWGHTLIQIQVSSERLFPEIKSQ